MLVSVTERTREIGIRKALGAKRSSVLSQFLIEALTLSSIGGIIGIIFGYIAAYVVAQIGGWPMVVSVPTFMFAFAFSLLVGIFFGIYPAIKASKLDPVVALSYE
jgi:putative ABC transport system permease protein